jgi:hypothetical protein
MRDFASLLVSSKSSISFQRDHDIWVFLVSKLLMQTVIAGTISIEVEEI